MTFNDICGGFVLLVAVLCAAAFAFLETASWLAAPYSLALVAVGALLMESSNRKL